MILLFLQCERENCAGLPASVERRYSPVVLISLTMFCVREEPFQRYAANCSTNRRSGRSGSGVTNFSSQSMDAAIVLESGFRFSPASLHVRSFKPRPEFLLCESNVILLTSNPARNA